MLNKEKIGKTITHYRKLCGYTQKELADMLMISYQAVSKWESGVNLPSLEMLCKISGILQVSVDTLLNRTSLDNRWINYEDTGLDRKRLYAVKHQIEELTTQDERMIHAHFADAALFKMDTAANGMNFMVQHGIKPAILQGGILCGNNSPEQLYRMANAFKRICVENDVMFGGMEIAAQAVNYRMDEYMVSATIVGVEDRKKLLTGAEVQEGDVLIGIETEGINGVHWPIVKVMIDKRPDMIYGFQKDMIQWQENVA